MGTVTATLASLLVEPVAEEVGLGVEKGLGLLRFALPGARARTTR